MLHEGIKVAHCKYNKEIQELEQIMERCLSSTKPFISFLKF